MKFKLQIILLLLTFKTYGQSVINSIALDSTGLLKWNITFIEPDLRIEIQRNLFGKWTTIRETGHQVNYFEDAPKTSVPMTVSDSCIVPLYKGINNYRIIMTFPAKLISKEVSTNQFLKNKKNNIYAQDNFIRFDNRVSFSINDSIGKEIRKSDYGRMINITDLKKGLYYIIVDGRNIYEFEKK